VKVKAHSFINAAAWFRTAYGDQALAEVLSKCGKSVRDRYVSAIALEWHSVDELIEFVQAAEAYLGKPRGQVATQMGATAARANVGGIVKRTVFYFANPDYLFRRIASMWRQYNDEGELTVREFNDRGASLELSAIAVPNQYFCALLTGWTLEVSKAMGVRAPKSVHSLCRARGDAQCIWELSWSGYEHDEAEINTGRANMGKELSATMNRLGSSWRKPPGK
jgi:hypothetical protein